MQRPYTPDVRIQQGRAGNGTACLGCGKPLHPKRGSRRQRYCSYRCRDEARRTRNFAVSAATRYPNKAIPRSVENTADQSTASKVGFGDRAQGIVGPAHVVEREVMARWNWRRITSPDGVVVEIGIVR